MERKYFNVDHDFDFAVKFGLDNCSFQGMDAWSWEVKMAQKAGSYLNRITVIALPRKPKKKASQEAQEKIWGIRHI